MTEVATMPQGDLDQRVDSRKTQAVLSDVDDDQAESVATHNRPE
jgi:hypothetical protein